MVDCAPISPIQTDDRLWNLAANSCVAIPTPILFTRFIEQPCPEGAFFLLPQEISEDDFITVSRSIGIDQDKLSIAMGFARTVHSEQPRNDGLRNHYTGHALLVPLYYAMIEINAGRAVEEDVFLAGVMHDIKEDGPLFNDDYLTAVFGAEVVDHLHTISKPPKSNYRHLQPPDLDLERESDYLAQFDGKGMGIKSLKCADKVANLRDDWANAGTSSKSLAYMREAQKLFLPFAETMIMHRREYAMYLRYMIEMLAYKHSMDFLS